MKKSNNFLLKNEYVLRKISMMDYNC